MSPDDPSPDPRKLSPEAEERLRAGLAAREKDAQNPVHIPPVEPLLEKWKTRRKEIQDEEKVVAFPAQHTPQATAARSGDAISPQSREKLSDLIKKLKSEKPPDAP